MKAVLFSVAVVLGCKLGSSGCEPAACLDACSLDALLHPHVLFTVLPNLFQE
jgi:hypothetical protein